MNRQAACPVCGTVFTADRITQKYCSPACRRYAHRHGANDHKPSPRKKKALRTFQCLKCGKKVRVTERGDRRTKFCSSHCERLYWKHSKRVSSVVIRRSFICRNCQKQVDVTDAHDRRTVFCGPECRTQWFSLARSAPKDERDRFSPETFSAMGEEREPIIGVRAGGNPGPARCVQEKERAGLEAASHPGPARCVQEKERAGLEAASHPV